MKVIRCEVCDATVWDKDVVKAFWSFKLNNICPCCCSMGSLRRAKMTKKEIKGLKYVG